jgi:AhpD family alkylhydroperoxidase
LTGPGSGASLPARTSPESKGDERLEEESMAQQDWTQAVEQAFAGIGILAKDNPGTLAGYKALHAAHEAGGRLDLKTRELICIAVAVTTRCDACIGNHVQKAIAAGATRAEIADALAVAVAMNAGAAIAYSGRAMEAFEQMSQRKAAE